jgi:hypothetical protein
MGLRRFGLILALFCTTSAFAEPQFSVLFGQSCFLCHSSPTGRAMRSLYGSQFFAPTYLPPKPVNFELLDKIKPQLSESVTIGADLRTIWMAQDLAQDSATTGLNAPISTHTGTSAQMEGYLYLSMQATEKFQINYFHNVSNGRFEVYGLANVLPFHGFIKVGQFQENYGWAFVDHTAFVRTGLFSGWNGTFIGSPLPPTYGVGGEIGVRPNRFDITGSLTDDAPSVYPWTFDSQRRWFGRASYQNGINQWGLQFAVGGSYTHAPSLPAAILSSPYFPNGATRSRAWGGFGGIGWQGLQGIIQPDTALGFGFLTTAILFEYDRKAWMPASAASPVTSAYSTTQVSIMLYPGVWVNGAYDWLDNGYPDATTGRAEAERTSIGAQFFPLPWVDIQPRYRLYSPVDHSNYRHAEVQVHFMF